jgi:sec-independent protein translocase protein TatC
VIVAWITLPFAVAFLTGFTVEGVAESVPSAESYFGFVTMIFLIFGAIMQFPIVLVLLHKLGILNVTRLRTARRYVLLGVVIFAVVATPGGDPVSPLVMSGVMYALFELTLFLIARGDRAQATDA